METVVRILDVCNTVLEMLILYACAEIICKDSSGGAVCGSGHVKYARHGRRNSCDDIGAAVLKYIPYIVVAVVVYCITWVVPVDTTKIVIEMAVWCLLMKITTGQKWRNLIAAFCISFYIIAAVSFLEMTVVWLVFGENSATIEGKQVFIWQNYILAMILNVFVIWGLFRYRKYFQYEIQKQDAALIGIMSFVFYIVCYWFGSSFYAGERQWYDMVSAVAAMLFGLCFLLLLFFYKNNMYLREQNMMARQQVKEAQMQYQYYLEKEKQEDRVRSIYHDMKNHLLLLESGKLTDETRRMAKKIRGEIAAYEEYVQSGNRFLDMILNDKIHKAKERHIDLSVFVDFSEITFIEPLDISTIFGNAIDNALNACDELPAEKRIVSVKCCKKENFVLIRIENNCSKSEDIGKRKADKGEASMHGYGIPNMERAVQKYDGECKIVRAEGRFVLTIMIPVPVRS